MIRRIAFCLLFFVVIIGCNSSKDKIPQVELLEVRLDSVFKATQQVSIDSLDRMIQTSRESLVELHKYSFPSEDTKAVQARTNLGKIKKIQKTSSAFREFEIEYIERNASLGRLKTSLEQNDYADTAFDSFILRESNHIDNLEKQVLNYIKIYNSAKLLYYSSYPYLDTLMMNLSLIEEVK